MKKRNDQNVIVKRAVLVFILMFLVLLAALAFFTRSIVMREQLKASYTARPPSPMWRPSSTATWRSPSC